MLRYRVTRTVEPFDSLGLHRGCTKLVRPNSSGLAPAFWSSERFRMGDEGVKSVPHVVRQLLRPECTTAEDTNFNV